MLAHSLRAFFYHLTWLLVSHTFAQVYHHTDSIAVIINGKTLSNPFTGGLNSCQYNNFDLNNDGIKDLLLFEKSTDKLMPFVITNADGPARYLYAPQYESLFPLCKYFALFRDYDYDGDEDLFTYAPQGVKVYRCVRIGSNIRFDLIKDPLESEYFGQSTNLLFNFFDLPLIDDLDADGDLDIVHFNALSGDKLEFHKNMSMERYGNAIHLEYKQTDDCYGGFQEIGCDEYNFNLDCKLLRRSLDKARLAHVGYGALLAFDADVDHKKDLLISKVDCPTINFLKNIGTPQTPTYQQAISKLSEKDTFQLAGFPNPFAVDVDGDGQQELVITPGTISSGFVLNFETSNYLFDKSLNLINTAFIQDQTIDLGEHTAPTSYDYDADGDQDLLVGYTTYKLNTKYRGGIALFENIQTDAEPIWVLRELDYKHLSEYQWVHITPQIFDVNNDGNTDLLITASSPQHLLNTYTFVYYGTTTGVSSSLDTLSIPLNFTDTPYFTRFNNQVKALVGKAKGTLMLYNKAGQTWILEKDSLGFTPTSDIKETVVCEANVDGDSLEDLLLCNSLKKLLYVQNYKTKGLSNWKIDTLLFYSNIDQQTYPIQLSRKSKLHSIFKIGSKSDIWAGSVAGGLYHFKSHDQHIASKDYQSIYPNPFFDELIIKSQHEDYYKLYELSGKLLEQGPIYKGHNLLSLPHLLAGVYILKLTTESKLIIKK